MDFNDISLLGKLSNIAQVTAIVLVFLAGFVQASKFFIDKRVSALKDARDSLAQHTIADLQTVVSSQEKKLGEQDTTLTLHVNKIAEQEAKIAESEQHLANLKERIQPRSIPTEKIELLRAELRKHTGESINFVTLMNDAEAMAYTSQLDELFRSAGWKTKGVSQAVFSKPIKGIIIVIKNDSITPKANYLLNLLHPYGFKPEGELDANMQEDLKIIVGSKE